MSTADKTKLDPSTRVRAGTIHIVASLQAILQAERDASLSSCCQIVVVKSKDTVGGEVFDGSEDITVDADDGVKIDGATIKHTNNVF